MAASPSGATIASTVLDGAVTSLAMSSRSTPAAKPIAGTWGPPEIRDHAVVAPSAEERAPCAELVVRAPDLEEGARVVVEPADEAGVDGVGRPQKIERGAQLREVLAVACVEELVKSGRVAHGGAIALVFGVEDAERVGPEAPLRFGRQRRELRRQVGDERVAVPGARLGAAQRVDEDLDAGDLQLGEESDEHVNHLGVAPGPLVAEDLRAELGELPVAPALGALGPEHRPDVPPARHRLALLDGVLDVRPCRAGRALGAQGQRLAVVLERVHLLLDDVGHFADGPHEERRRLDVRRAHLAKAVQAHRAGVRALDALPAPDLVGQHVVHPFDGSERSHGKKR